MSTTINAQEIGKEWLAFVTAAFMLKDGAIRPDVQDEYNRLESTDTITRERELWRNHTDALIDNILGCSTLEIRKELLSGTDSRSLAYVQDRIQCGTELLIALAQKGLQINLGETTSLQDYFRLILQQKLS